MSNAQNLSPELLKILEEIKAQNAPGVAPGAAINDAAAEAGAAARELACSVGHNVAEATRWTGRFLRAAFRGAPPKPRVTPEQIRALQDAGLI